MSLSILEVNPPFYFRLLGAALPLLITHVGFLSFQGDFCFGTALGLEPFSGLAVPWPEIDRQREPLWLQKQYAAPGSQVRSTSSIFERVLSKDVQRSTLTQQPTTPWSSLLQPTPRPCHTRKLSLRFGETTRNCPGVCRCAPTWFDFEFPIIDTG